MDENELTDRLTALGEAPVPDHARVDHLRRIASTPTGGSRRSTRLWIAAAAIVGFLAGSTGLAAAGALPDPAQDVAHDVLSVVQVDVPEGNRGACVSEIARSDRPEAEKKAAKDACPKGGRPDTPGRTGAPGQTKHVDDPCRGAPPWAGKNDLTEADKDALKAERAAACGDDDAAPEEDEEGG